MYVFIIGLIIFISILLGLVILAQNSKGGGLSSQFGGSSASNIMGVKKTGDLLEKLTWGFIIAIMALVLSTNFVPPNEARADDNELIEDINSQAAPELPTAPPAQQQATPADSAGN